MNWIFRYRPWIILLYLLAFGLSLWYTLTNLNIHTNTQNMISEELPWRQDFIRYQTLFPSQHQTLYVVLEGPSSETTEKLAQDLKQALLLKPKITSVFAYTLTDFFQKNRLLYMSQEELKALSLKLPNLLPLMDLTASDLGLFLTTLNKHIDNPLAGENIVPLLDSLPKLMQASMTQSRLYLEGGTMLGKELPKSPHILEVKAQLNFSNSLPGDEVLKTIQATFEQLNTPWLAQSNMAITGEIALANEELKSVSQGAEIAALAAFLMVALLLMVSFKSWRLVTIALVSLILGLVMTAAFATLVIGHLNMISVAFAVLYIGLSVDFTIHIILRYREAYRFEPHVLKAIKTSIRHLAPSLVLCALTTSMAFFSFLPTSFKGVSELGLIAGTGMLISLIINLTWLPLLLSYHPKMVLSKEQPPSKIWKLPTQYPRTIIALFAGLSILSLTLLNYVEFNADPMSLRDPNQPSVVTFEKLLNTLEYPPNSATVLDESSNLLIIKDQLQQLSTVKDTLDIQTFVPKDQKLKLKTIDTLKTIYNMREKASEHQENTTYRTQALIDFSESVKTNFPEHPVNHSFEDYLAWLDTLPESERQEVLSQLSQSILFGLVSRLKQIKDGFQAQAFDQEQLPKALRDRWVQQDIYRLEVFPKGSMRSPLEREQFVNQLLTLAPHATGLPVIHEKAGEEVVYAFQQAFTIAFLLLLSLLTIVLRDIKKILLTLVPLLIACIITGGLSVVFGLEFNFANIIALPLLLGVGIDNGIHLVHRFYTEADHHVLDTSTSRAVLVSTLTTLFSFANLALSAHQGMSSMGMMLTLGMLIMLSATLLLLPALLSLIHGKNKGH